MPLCNTPVTAEEWRIIDGLTHYQISDHGRVKRTRILKNGPVEIITFGYVGNTGYRYIDLRTTAIGKVVTVHTIVAQIFIGPRPDGYHVNHKDQNKLNNNVDNLEYVTPKENIGQSAALGKVGTWHRTAEHRRYLAQLRLGVAASNRKLTFKDAEQIRALNIPLTAIAKMFDISKKAVLNIKQNKTYRS